jgi:hypothetical protein
MWPERTNRPPELAKREHRPDIITAFHCRVRRQVGLGHGGARRGGRDRFARKRIARGPRGGDLDAGSAGAGLCLFDAGRAREHSATVARRTRRHAVREEDGTTGRQYPCLGSGPAGTRTARPMSCRRTAPAGHTSRSAAASHIKGEPADPASGHIPAPQAPALVDGPAHTCPALFQSVAAPN